MVNAEQVEMVKTRHEAKAKLLAEMRAERAAAVLDTHSHIGVELSRLVQPDDLRLITYQTLAGLANLLGSHQQDGAGRLLASLARGFERGSHEMWGPEAATALREAIALDPAKGVMPPATPQPEPPMGQDPSGTDTSPRAVDGFDPEGEEYVAGENEDGYKTAGLITDMPGDSVPPYDIALEARDEGLELDLRSLDLPALDPDDVPSAAEPAASPEPQETPQARAARMRRAAKAAKTQKAQ